MFWIIVGVIFIWIISGSLIMSWENDNLEPSNRFLLFGKLVLGPVFVFGLLGGGLVLVILGSLFAPFLEAWENHRKPKQDESDKNPDPESDPDE